MSGQQPPQGPWQGPPPQQWQPGPPYPPAGGGGRRKGAWIVVAVVAIVAVIAGGTFAGLTLLGDSDDTSSPSDEPSPSDSPTTAPTNPTEPTDPSSSPTEPTGDWGAVSAAAEINAVSDAVAAAGYACYNTLETPVLVRRCFLDPATDKYDEQRVTIQAAFDGAVNSIDIEVGYFDGRRKSAPKFNETVRTLVGTVLKAPEANAIINGQRSQRHTRETLAWGKSDLFTFRNGDTYQLELIAKGAENVVLPASDTSVSVVEVRQHYTDAGFSCHVQPSLKTLRCERRLDGGALTVLAFDECLNSSKKYESICEGHNVYSLTGAAEFNSGMPEREYAKFFDDFIPPLLNLAAGSSTFADDVGSEIADWTKPHRLDVEGLHVELMPGFGSLVGGFEQAYEVTIQGINLTA